MPEAGTEWKRTNTILQSMLMSWFSHEADPEYDHGRVNTEIPLRDPLIRLLHTKLREMKFDVFVPDELWFILCLSSQNPGFMQVMLHEILENIPDLKSGYSIKLEDFFRTYPKKFPVAFTQDGIKEYEAKWDAQKTEDENGCTVNKVDDPNYWMSLLHDEEPKTVVSKT